MLTQAQALALKTAQQSFWNSYFAIPDAFENLIYRRNSSQKTDTFARLGAAPMPSEWVGDKNALRVPEFSTTVTNTSYEATVKIDREFIKYQQWDEIGNLVGNLGEKARAHKVKLASTLVSSGHATTCEDGQFFFDTDHANTGAAYTTSQDNDKTSAAATGTQPTDLEMASAIRGMFDALYSFKDDRGDPTVPQDENPANFIVMVPPVYRSVATQVMRSNSLTGPIGNDLQNTFTVRVNPFLTDADRFYMFYAGSVHKPLGMNEVSGVETKYWVDDNSGHIYYSVEWYGKLFYGQWRTAVSHIFT